MAAGFPKITHRRSGWRRMSAFNRQCLCILHLHCPIWIVDCIMNHEFKRWSPESGIRWEGNSHFANCLGLAAHQMRRAAKGGANATAAKLAAAVVRDRRVNSSRLRNQDQPLATAQASASGAQEFTVPLNPCACRSNVRGPCPCVVRCPRQWISGPE